MAKRIIYYSDPLRDDFADNHIHTKAVDRHFPFLHRSRLWALWSFLVYYGVATPVVFLISKIYLGLKFENHRQLRKVRASGYFLYGNHTRGLDAFLPAMAAFPKRSYIVAGPDAVSIPGLRNWCSFWDASRFRLIGADFQLFWRLWSGAFTGSCIGIFPEAHIWPFNRCPSLRGYFPSGIL
ncbi:MAG: hypothetical protein ACLSHU_03350 [Oscillospiraceae bacterium]